MPAMDDVGRVNAVLDRLLAKVQAPPRLGDAMRYAVLGGGKRIRPRLVYAAGRLAGAGLDTLDHAAAATELIHAYSLVHDDLPAMDDDALRHGYPTLHIRYDEATAILAGDALQALAFETASADSVEASLARRWVALLAGAAGAAGMVGGQILDLDGEARQLTLTELEALHRGKCGALIHAAVMMGAIAGALSPPEVDALGQFADAIGLAFQIHDDVLDATTSTAVLGKPAGSDRRQHKSTYVSQLGIKAAAAEAERHHHLASEHLRPLGERARALSDIADHIVRRSN